MSNISKGDIYFIETLEKLRNESSVDEKPRGVWEDGTPAHCNYITNQTFSYDINKGEFPLTTLRKTALKKGIAELFVIYQEQSNFNKDFLRLGVDWWDKWLDENDSLGSAYSFNLESGRRLPDQINMNHITNEKTLYKPKVYNELVSNINYTIKNVPIDLFDPLYKLWKSLNDENVLCNEWCNFTRFLIEVKYVPNYFIWRDESNEMTLNRYDKTKPMSLNNAIFIDNEDMYYAEEYLSENNILGLYNVSRNQVVDLLYNLEHDTYSKRHMISFFNWNLQPLKTLVECAFMNIFNVRKVNNVFYLDQNLIQRSSDYLVASYINAAQYTVFGEMICSHLRFRTGNDWRMGNFKYDVNNLHCYDRHYKFIDEVLNNKPIPGEQYARIEVDKDFFSITEEDIIIKTLPGIPKLSEKLEIVQ